MSEKPILFSGPMVRAILDWRKSMTRRTVKPQPTFIESSGRWKWPLPKKHSNNGKCPAVYTASREWYEYAPPEAFPYQPGDVLWVREKTRESLIGSESMTEYLADGWAPRIKWNYSRRTRPAIHLPRRFARLFLRVKAVRVERLQEISEDDCYAEGTLEWADAQDLRHSDGTPAKYPSVRHAFRALWDSLNAERAPWASNPWVWVYSFERV